MERASSRLAALVPIALRLWVTSADAERASPLALLRRLFEVVAAEASPCESACAACKRCRDASVPPPAAAPPLAPAASHPSGAKPPPRPQAKLQPKPQPKPQPVSQSASQLLSQLLPQVKPQPKPQPRPQPTPQRSTSMQSQPTPQPQPRRLSKLEIRPSPLSMPGHGSAAAPCSTGGAPARNEAGKAGRLAAEDQGTARRRVAERERLERQAHMHWHCTPHCTIHCTCHMHCAHTGACTRQHAHSHAHACMRMH